MLDPLTIGLFVLIAVMIFFMFRNSRKRRQETEALQAKLVPGAEVMTQHGIYGTLISLDDEKNEAIIETVPGSRLRLHRQTIARVIDRDIPESEPSELDAAELDSSELDADAALEGEPEFGERTDAERPSPAKPSRPPRKKPTE